MRAYVLMCYHLLNLFPILALTQRPALAPSSALATYSLSFALDRTPPMLPRKTTSDGIAAAASAPYERHTSASEGDRLVTPHHVSVTRSLARLDRGAEYWN
eukprot:COSAG06_NODE_1536_length_9152_cov_19.634044_3_plen_101_part_00